MEVNLQFMENFEDQRTTLTETLAVLKVTGTDSQIQITDNSDIVDNQLMTITWKQTVYTVQMILEEGKENLAQIEVLISILTQILRLDDIEALLWKPDWHRKKARIIYVLRNPKDVLVSTYHFSKITPVRETPKDFDTFLEWFLAGKVPSSLWLDHVEGWYTHKDDFNILFLSYEEMKKDLRRSVLKICSFLGKKLTAKEVDDVVDKATFDNMKVDSRANYTFIHSDIVDCRKKLTANEVDDVVDKVTFDNMKVDSRANYTFMPSDIVDCSKGDFLRKGTVGDWKSTMTVAQNEKFDRVFKDRIEKLPFKFCWDIQEDPEPISSSVEENNV
ncbi:amine sulfotransferase-like [Crotalus tigris]|nr:amine sulfotransferase-like [Crotalus tigris]